MKRCLACALAALLALTACLAFAADSAEQQMDKLDALRTTFVEMGLMDWDEEVPGMTDQEGTGYADSFVFGEFLFLDIIDDPEIDATRYECAILISGLPDGVELDDMLPVLVATINDQVQTEEEAADIVASLWEHSIPGEGASEAVMELDNYTYDLYTSDTDSEVGFFITVP